MKWKLLCRMTACCALATGAFADVSVQETAQVTSNRSGEVTTQVVQQMASPAGGMIVWQQEVTVAKPTKPGVTEAVREVSQRDLKGQLRLELRQVSTTTQSPTGQTKQTTEYARDAAGRLALRSVTDEVTQKTANGWASTSVERAPDINGELVRRREVQTELRVVNANEQSRETRTRSFDPVAGEYRLTNIETTTTQSTGDGSRSETVTRDVGNDAGGGRVVARKVSASQRLPAGLVQTETIVYGLSQYARNSTLDRTELVPQQKILERVVTKPDGTTTLQREYYRRDVNNEWKPVTLYPTDAPAK